VDGRCIAMAADVRAAVSLVRMCTNGWRNMVDAELGEWTDQSDPDGRMSQPTAADQAAQRFAAAASIRRVDLKDEKTAIS